MVGVRAPQLGADCGRHRRRLDQEHVPVIHFSYAGPNEGIPERQSRGGSPLDLGTLSRILGWADVAIGASWPDAEVSLTEQRVRCWGASGVLSR